MWVRGDLRATDSAGPLRWASLTLWLALAVCHAFAEDAPRCKNAEPVQHHRAPRGLLALDVATEEETVLAPTTIARSLEEATSFNSFTGRSSALDVSSVLFREVSARVVVLRQDWEQRLQNISGEIEAMYDKGAVFALLMGDQLLWRNVSFAEWTAVATRLKTYFPFVRLYATEAVEVFATGRNVNGYVCAVPSIPASIDFLSIRVHQEGHYRRDAGRGGEMKAVANTIDWQRWLYESYVYPKMSNEQRVIPSLALAEESSLTNWSAAFDAFVAWSHEDPQVGGAVHLPSPHQVGELIAPCYEEYLAALVDRHTDTSRSV